MDYSLNMEKILHASKFIILTPDFKHILRYTKNTPNEYEVMKKLRKICVAQSPRC